VAQQLSTPHQQEEWRSQYAALGLPVPRFPLAPPPRPRPVGDVTRDFSAQLAFSAIPFPLARPASLVTRRAANFFAPRRVGVHHTIYGRGVDASLYRPWNTPTVKPSGLHGTTAGDQIPGMSYMWSAGGRGGSLDAARLAQGQTNLIFNNQMLSPGTQGVGKVVTAPRFSTLPDPNLLGTRAAMVKGPQLRVAGEVASRSGPLTGADASLLSSMANRQKLIEAGRSAAKIGATAGAGAGLQNIDIAAIRQLLR
jgi:hypothetical protein